jgi:hypothetical protein
MTNQIVAQTKSVSLITEADRQAAKNIKMLLPYGDKLTDDNAIALVAYSRLHGLDPFNGECYFLVREKVNDRGEVIKREELGVYPGIKGKRKKAKEQLNGETYRIDYNIVGPEAVGLKVQAGEIAIVVEAQLRDSISTEQYLKEFYQLQKNETPGELIRAILGKPPVWTGYGVVKQSELRYIKQSPVVLAKKRAESDATNQRFDLPFSDDALADDVAPEIIGMLENGKTNDSEPVLLEGVVTEKQSTEQLMAELGFDMPPEDMDEPQEPPQDPLWPATDEMTIEVANAFGRLTSTKQKYGDQDNERLGYMRKAVSKSLEAAETQEEQDKYQNKLNDIEIILDWRKQHSGA